MKTYSKTWESHKQPETKHRKTMTTYKTALRHHANLQKKKLQNHGIPIEKQ